MLDRLKRQEQTRSKPRAHNDSTVESAVHDYIVAECPEGVTIPILALHFNAEFDQGLSGSAVERAVRELDRDGWLQMRGGKVVPVRPARSLAR